MTTAHRQIEVRKRLQYASIRTVIRMKDFLPIFMVFGFVLWWSFICILLSYVSGWRTLRRVYPFDEPFPIPYEPFSESAAWGQSGSVGWVAYRGCLNVAWTKAGLVLSTVIIFRLGHKAILIPWSDIESITVRNWLITKSALIKLTKATAPTITIRGRHAELIFTSWRSTIDADARNL